MTKAERIAKALLDNADAVHTDSVDWETFSRRNRALWRKAEDPKVRSRVLALLRNHEEK